MEVDKTPKEKEPVKWLSQGYEKLEATAREEDSTPVKQLGVVTEGEEEERGRGRLSSGSHRRSQSRSPSQWQGPGVKQSSMDEITPPPRSEWSHIVTPLLSLLTLYHLVPPHPTPHTLHLSHSLYALLYTPSPFTPCHLPAFPPHTITSLPPPLTGLKRTQWKNCGQKAVTRPLIGTYDTSDVAIQERHRQQQRFREAQLIQREMSQLDRQFEELEEVGRNIEQCLRDADGSK